MKSSTICGLACIVLPWCVCAQVRIVTDELPPAAIGADYRAGINSNVDGRCEMGDVILLLAAGQLPKGIKLGALGLDGVPREMGRFRFTIRAENTCATTTRKFELVVTGKPVLEAAPDEITFTCRTPAQAPASRTILVSSTWPNLPYSVETRNADWLHARQEQGVTPDPTSAITSDVVTLTADPSKLQPGTYRGSVVFWTRHGANAPVVSVVLIVGSSK